MIRSKLKTLSSIKKIVERFKRQDKRVVFTNGCFDILHYGHVQYLEQARSMGDCLVLGLNSDRSVRMLKGRGRPFNNVHDRAGVLAGLSSVDYIIVFDDKTPLKLIEKIKPNILVKGSDWPVRAIVGAQEVKAWGGRIRRVRLFKGRSTTRLVRRMQKARRVSFP